MILRIKSRSSFYSLLSQPSGSWGFTQDQNVRSTISSGGISPSLVTTMYWTPYIFMPAKVTVQQGSLAESYDLNLRRSMSHRVFRGKRTLYSLTR